MQHLSFYCENFVGQKVFISFQQLKKKNFTTEKNLMHEYIVPEIDL